MKGSIAFLVFLISLLVFLAGCYVGNVIKLVNCDFDNNGSWKGEIVYAIGLTGFAPITVWFNYK